MMGTRWSDFPHGMRDRAVEVCPPLCQLAVERIENRACRSRLQRVDLACKHLGLDRPCHVIEARAHRIEPTGSTLTAWAEGRGGFADDQNQ
jgi:hypothetical protein